MKAFGYVRGDSAAEHPVALQEVTLSVTIKELERVITFLQQAKFGGSWSTYENAESFRSWVACEGRFFNRSIRSAELIGRLNHNHPAFGLG